MSSPRQVAESLRSRILDLRLPPGAPLREIALAEEFDCSRRTVREALLGLSREGLVRHERNRGAAVRAFSTDDVVDLYLVRRTLEGQGAAACQSAPQELLLAVDRAFDALVASARAGQDTAEHAIADMRFHASVIGLIGSPRIDGFFDRIATEMAYAIRLLQRDEVETRIEPDAVVADHQRIRDAVLAHNPLEAQRAVQDHIAENEERLLRLCAARPSG